MGQTAAQRGSRHTAQAGGTQGHPAGCQPGGGNRGRTLKCHRTSKGRGPGSPSRPEAASLLALVSIACRAWELTPVHSRRLQRSKPASLRRKLPRHTCAVHVPPALPRLPSPAASGRTLGPWAALLWSCCLSVPEEDRGAPGADPTSAQTAAALGKSQPRWGCGFPVDNTGGKELLLSTGPWGLRRAGLRGEGSGCPAWESWRAQTWQPPPTAEPETDGDGQGGRWAQPGPSLLFGKVLWPALETDLGLHGPWTRSQTQGGGCGRKGHLGPQPCCSAPLAEAGRVKG